MRSRYLWPQDSQPPIQSGQFCFYLFYIPEVRDKFYLGLKKKGSQGKPRKERLKTLGAM